MSGYDDNDRSALDRLEDLLDAYSALRLAPAGPALPRIRGRVLAQYAAHARLGTVASRPDLPVQAAKSWLPRPSLDPRFAHRALAFGFAATLAVGTSAAVLAAPPGSPFYNARVAVESALLPTQVNARLAARQDLLNERVAEAELAAVHGDVAGLAAALAAYRAEVDAATADVGDDAARRAHLEEALSKHSAALAGLAAKHPDEPSIANALDASSKAIGQLHGETDQPTQGPSGQDNGGSEDRGHGNNGGNGHDRGNSHDGDDGHGGGNGQDGGGRHGD